MTRMFHHERGAICFEYKESWVRFDRGRPLSLSVAVDSCNFSGEAWLNARHCRKLAAWLEARADEMDERAEQ